MKEGGQVNLVAGVSIAAIVGVIAIIIFANIYDALNTEKISTESVTLLNLIDLLLAAVLVIGIVGVLAFRSR